jgi:hypothetical protein
MLVIFGCSYKYNDAFDQAEEIVNRDRFKLPQYK